MAFKLVFIVLIAMLAMFLVEAARHQKTQTTSNCDVNRDVPIFSSLSMVPVNHTCPTGETPCQWSKTKFSCCRKGESCWPNVGCEC